VAVKAQGPGGAVRWEGMEAAHCSQCLRVVEERLGYRSRAGEVLCGPCYLNAPTAPRVSLLTRAAERLHLIHRRASGKTVWIPGPGSAMAVRRHYGSQIPRS
jgi:hypothetical protein